ncbi:MAG TPA: sulfatase-like hydrolase/transferase [Thermoleophilaceae bacterium]|nr:sulfatase-like hydrolase/transferase [Thermoleophilaceae bacterium]
MPTRATSSGASAEPSTERPGKRSLLFAGLHVGALWTLAVAEPLFDLIRKNPDFLAARGLQGGDVVLFALALALAPPLILWGLEALAWLIDHRAQRALHLLFMAALAGLIAIQALKKTSLDGSVAVIALSAVIGVAAAALYSRAAPVRSFVTVLSPAPLVFLLLFLFISPIKDLVLPAGASASDVQVSGSVPVVMVVFDEVATPALEDAHGRIDPVLYPNLASLARNGTWFRYATAPTDETTTATPAIMTGSLPKRHGLPILSQYPHNLFTLLGRSYRMIVSQEATDLCPRNLCQEPTRGSLAQRERSLASDTGLVYLHMIAPPHIESDLASVSSTLGGFAGDNGRTRVATPVEKHTGRTPVLHELAGGRPERFERLVGTIERRPLKTLYFKHSLLPHVPFQYLPSGRRYWSRPHEAIPGIVDAPSWGNDFLLAQAYQRHLLQMQFADRLLGTLLRRLKQVGLYDRALIVVTADNGESFLHHANRHEVTPQNFEDIADTPLIIKAPGERRGRIDDRHVSTIDILPTIADLLHIRLPWRVDGTSLWRRGAPIPQDVEMFQRSGRRLTESFPEFKRRVRASLDRKLRLFGSDGAGPGLYGIGPEPALLGRPVGSPPRGGLSASINLAGAYRSVDLRSGFVPALITGAISGPGTPGRRDIAVAVNGRIVATAPSFELAGSHTENFSALVPESTFRQGDNRVQILWVRGGPAQPQLQLIGEAG